MDLGRAFNYPMKDQNWIVKLLIGAVISLIPIVNFIASGFQVRAIREVLNGNEERLPEWDDFGGDFMRGLIVAVFLFVYQLPATIVYCCLSLFGSALDSGSEGGGAGGLLVCCALPFILVYSIAASAMFAPGLVRYAATDDFNVFLDFGGRWRDVTSNTGALVTLVLYGIVIYLVIGLVVSITIWLCGLGLLFLFAGQLMLANLLAQYGAELGLGGAPLRKNDALV